MTLGHCTFCTLDGLELVDSHYLSKSAFKGFLSDELECPHPLILKNGRMFQSSEQVHDVAFCRPCEEIFNRAGENWLLPKLASANHGFPLRDLVKTAPFTLLPPDEEMRLYRCGHSGEIDCDSLSHFGLGIFWKGHAHKWERCERLSLGHFGEGLRLYLRGEGPFPKDAALNVTIVPCNQPLWSGRLPMQTQKSPYHSFNFYLRGLEFTLSVGKAVPGDLREWCLIGNSDRPILAGMDVLRYEWETMRLLKENAIPSRKLAEFESKPRNHTLRPPSGPDW